MRKRFKTTRIASSDYEISQKLKKEYLRDWHNANIEIVEEISASLVTKKKFYVKVFGTLVQISEEELKVHSTIHNTLIIEK